MRTTQKLCLFALVLCGFSSAENRQVVPAIAQFDALAARAASDSARETAQQNLAGAQYLIERRKVLEAQCQANAVDFTHENCERGRQLVTKNLDAHRKAAESNFLLSAFFNFYSLIETKTKSALENVSFRRLAEGTCRAFMFPNDKSTISSAQAKLEAMATPEVRKKICEESLAEIINYLNGGELSPSLVHFLKIAQENLTEEDAKKILELARADAAKKDEATAHMEHLIRNRMA